MKMEDVDDLCQFNEVTEPLRLSEEGVKRMRNNTMRILCALLVEFSGPPAGVTRRDYVRSAFLSAMEFDQVFEDFTVEEKLP